MACPARPDELASGSGLRATAMSCGRTGVCPPSGRRILPIMACPARPDERASGSGLPATAMSCGRRVWSGVSIPNKIFEAEP